jgi:hypothetical protein
MNLCFGPDDKSRTRMASEHDHHHHDLMHCSPSARFRFLGSDGQRQLTDDQSINQSGEGNPLPSTPLHSPHPLLAPLLLLRKSSQLTWMRPKPAGSLSPHVPCTRHTVHPTDSIEARRGEGEIPSLATRPSADPRRGEARGTTGGQGRPGRRSSSVECPRDRGSDRLDGDYQT